MRPIWIHRGPPNRTFDGLGCLVGSDGASWAIPAKADDGERALSLRNGHCFASLASGGLVERAGPVGLTASGYLIGLCYFHESEWRELQ